MAVDSTASAELSSPARRAPRRLKRGELASEVGTPSIGDLSSPGAFGAESQSSAGRDEDGGEVANAVSQLQEYIQGRLSFSPHTKILTWSFETQLENDTALRFRAVVSFVF